MTYKVIYFTKTGNSKRIAEKIAAKLSCEILQVTDTMSWNGLIGFLKGGYYSLTNKPVDIKIDKEIGPEDELIAVSPLWAGGIAPTMKTFLNTVSPGRVDLVVVSGNSTLEKREGFKSVSDIVQSKKSEDAVIDGLVNTLLQ